MRPIWRLAIGSWWASPSRVVAAVVSVALGVGVVVTVTTAYETAHRGIVDHVVTRWLGSAHLTVHSPGAHWGAIEESLTDVVRQLDSVEHISPRLHRRMEVLSGEETGDAGRARPVDAIGIEPDTVTHFRSFPDLHGRMIRAGERGVVIIEDTLAEALDVAPGDRVRLRAHGYAPAQTFSVIGTVAGNRVAEFQRPVVYLPLRDAQALTDEGGLVSVIDVALTDASPEALEQAAQRLREMLSARASAYPYQVDTARARQLMLAEAERVMRLVMMLVAFIASLTAFFIILSTQGVGLQQRRPQLGVMRCVGTTRAQMAALMLAEIVPPGLVGIAAGVGGGLAVVYGLATALGDVASEVWLSRWGIGIACAAGLVTILLSAAFVVAQVCHVAPLEAVRTEAWPARKALIYAVSAMGVVLLALHVGMVEVPDQIRWLQPGFAAVGTGSLYLGYAMLAPVLVALAGPVIARIVGRGLGLRARLVAAPLVRSPWRATGACWVLMVGLSLIVYVAVRAESVLAVWDFPSRLPDAFVWSPDYVPGPVIERVRSVPGVGRVTTSTDVPCSIEVAGRDDARRDSLIDRFLRRLTQPVFVAGEPDELLSMIKVAFTEGSHDEAVRKLKRGGYVLLPPQAARYYDLHVGDEVTVTIRGRSVPLEVGGIVQSPALDMAVTAFQAETYMQLAAASAILGTRSDLKERFGLDIVSMFMFDVELSSAAPPAEFGPESVPDPGDDAAVAEAILSWREHLPGPDGELAGAVPALRSWLSEGASAPLPEAGAPVVRRFASAIRRAGPFDEGSGHTAATAWAALREWLVIQRVAGVMDRPDAIKGSLRRLTEQVDRGLRRAMTIVTWLPSIVLVVAALGIGNLMMVSVQQRIRQIGVLRAIGAERSYVQRLVLAEAVTTGLLGSVIGVALGIHVAYTVNHVAAALVGVVLEFIVPVGVILAAVGLTVGVCVAAGVTPARRAARQGIVTALQSP